MPAFKLTYFNARGKAEVIRLTLTAAGQTFEDVRIERENWQALKPTMPLEQLPVLEIDGKKIGQSNAITRSLARTYDLYGTGNDEMTMVDVVMDTVEDSFTNGGKIIFEKDAEKKASLIKDFEDNFLVRFGKFMSSLLEENKTNGWLVGSKMTIADLALLNMEDFIRACICADKEVEDVFRAYPKLLEHRQKIKETPAIKKYLAERPQTQF